MEEVDVKLYALICYKRYYVQKEKKTSKGREVERKKYMRVITVPIVIAELRSSSRRNVVQEVVLSVY